MVMFARIISVLVFYAQYRMFIILLYM